MLAARLLVDGHDNPALRQATSITAKDDPRDIREALNELCVWIPDRSTAQLHLGVQAARDLVVGRISIEECGRRVRDIWEFDDLIYRTLPADLDELVSMCWVFGEEYDRNGGDHRLLAAAQAVAERSL